MVVRSLQVSIADRAVTETKGVEGTVGGGAVSEELSRGTSPPHLWAKSNEENSQTFSAGGKKCFDRRAQVKSHWVFNKYRIKETSPGTNAAQSSCKQS